MHWSFNYIGLPWEERAVGPDSFDCWGLVVHCFKKYYGINDLELYLGVGSFDLRGIHKAAMTETKKIDWVQVAEPVDGSLVLMSRGRFFHHVGIFTDGAVLHSLNNTNVCRESIERLKRLNITKLEYWVNKKLCQQSQF